MALLRPFRQLHENDVVNLYAYEGDIPAEGVSRGSIVKIHTTTGAGANKGWSADDEFENVSINNNYPNTVSDRWAVKARIKLAASGDTVKPLGMMLYDVAEYDENGEKLLWHPLKGHEMQVALSGQAVPVLMRGIVMVNGIDDPNGLAQANAKVYADDNGDITTESTGRQQIGRLLGPVVGSTALNGNPGDVLMKLEL